MNKILVWLTVILSYSLPAQTYQSQNISLLGLLAPNTSVSTVNKYSGCWGWYQKNKNKEYAISGASNGTYFIDLTLPSTPTLSAFLPGKTDCIWREMKTYRNYCYIVSDDAAPNKFQIVDMQYLPDSVHIIHNSNVLFERGHTIWIDTSNARMYIGSTTFTSGYSPMTVYSLATPTAPLLLRKLEADISPSVINTIHDMYVRNDTVYASAGYQGLFIFKYNAVANIFTQLGSYSLYQKAGYNHSSFLTQNGKYLMFCDEQPANLPIHFVDVQNPGNIQPLKDFSPSPGTTAHNPYIIGNNIAVVSSYQDGVWIYDISNPNAISQAGYFDTYPQGGVNTGTYIGTYGGNWGAYPYLPSGILLANDMENGLFVLNPSQAYNNPIKNIVGLEEKGTEKNLLFYPNPAVNDIAVHYNTSNISTVNLKNMLGQVVYEKQFSGTVSEHITVRDLANGTYIISVTENNQTKNKKLIIHH